MTEKPEYGAPPAGGLRTTLLERPVNVYPLAESELDAVSSGNLRVNTWIAVSSGLGTSFLSLLIGGFQVDRTKLSMTGAALFEWVPWLFLVLAIVTGLLAAWEWIQKRSIVNKIKSECKQPGGIVATAPVPR